MIDPLAYIASDPDLCTWCFKNKPSNDDQLLEFTINCGLCFIETGVPIKEPVFDPWEYIACYPDTLKCFWKDGTLDTKDATLAWIYYGTENKLSCKRFDEMKKYFEGTPITPAKWFLHHINFPSYQKSQEVPFGKHVINNIWYINLDRRQDRNIKTIGELSKAQVPYFNKYSAVDARVYPSASAVSICNGGGCINDRIKNKPGNEWIIEDNLRVKAKTACTMSHFHLWKRAAMYDNGWVLVFEDDFRCNYVFSTFLKNFEECLNTNPDADMVIFSNRCYISGKQSNAGTDGYALKVECAKRMWKYNEPNSKMYCDEYSLDNHYNSLRKSGWLKIYSLDQPFIINDDQGKSDIEV